MNTLIIEDNQQLAAVIRRAKDLGLTILDVAHLPADVYLVNGEWPGVRPAQESGAGPTGVPWLDANAWRVRLARGMFPGKEIWATAEKPKRILSTEDHLVAIADAAMAGGKWVFAPDAEFRDWDRVGEWMRWFAGRPVAGEVKAAIGVMSTFSGKNEFLATELLNLLGRAQQPVRTMLPDAAITDLACVVYADGAPPASILDFARRGGLAVVRKYARAGGAVQDESRYLIYAEGKGRIAVCKDAEPDPFQLAQDVQVLMSHRHDPVRFWNAGSVGSQLTENGMGVLLQMVNYAGRSGNDSVSVRVKGQYRKAVLKTPGKDATLPVIAATGGTEVRLPPFPIYAALELS